ncbi:helix-turn-helix domain-containing protein [Vibrio parahaemolyticus]|uniref:helix-turn-helix domain-containing protein n=1 Tax=Vibrio parahaemolyticus TaxID=670 RepID=UPI001124B886|nr:helix-turn-helix transcriptional regulator [Vibrio parahaemolyticus]EHZ2538537.1 helix-turn-helix transcriptional regulator [Vibrio parahaemolyticus]ELA9815380.1 helix-turn-helix transcriptional regulator [Vibrio parahaemolyticus]MBE4330463.1 helix-turn-helix transcriptional regulator [Vibrio parahaemolyticus]MBE4330467.1 helix-turn-helix transcriptional regulator [Vibrio parahaemolyticus]MBE4343504.1 helix-turn-helix transcriptional regulator [Vibrio parahaemolyticus]
MSLQDKFEVNNVAIGENLRRLRRDKHLTQGDLAELCNIRVGQISKIERNEVDPKLSTIYSLIDALECSPNALLNDVSETNLDGLLSMVLERVQKLPDASKNSLIDIMDKYCIAMSMQALLDRSDNKIFGLANFAGSNEEMKKQE